MEDTGKSVKLALSPQHLLPSHFLPAHPTSNLSLPSVLSPLLLHWRRTVRGEFCPSLHSASLACKLDSTLSLLPLTGGCPLPLPFQPSCCQLSLPIPSLGEARPWPSTRLASVAGSCFSRDGPLTRSQDGPLLTHKCTWPGVLVT